MNESHPPKNEPSVSFFVGATFLLVLFVDAALFGMALVRDGWWLVAFAVSMVVSIWLGRRIPSEWPADIHWRKRS